MINPYSSTLYTHKIGHMSHGVFGEKTKRQYSLKYTNLYRAHLDKHAREYVGTWLLWLYVQCVFFITFHDKRLSFANNYSKLYIFSEHNGCTCVHNNRETQTIDVHDRRVLNFYVHVLCTQSTQIGTRCQLDEWQLNVLWFRLHSVSHL